MSIFESIASRFGYVKQPKRTHRPAGKRAVDGFSAADTSRLFADFKTSDASIDTYLASQLPIIRARGRKLTRDNDYAKKFLRLLSVNVVGPDGIMMQMDVRDPNGSQDLTACDIIEESWHRWCQAENLTVTKQIDMRELEDLVICTEATEGEIFVRMVDGFDNPFKFAIQIIKSDYLDHTYNARLSNGGEIRLGIEYNRWKQPVAGHFFKRNPNDYHHFGGYQTERERISFADLIHIFLRIDPEQSRGVSWFQTSMLRLQMLGAFEDAALVQQRVGASKMGFFEQVPDQNGNYTGDSTDVEGNTIAEVAPGQFEVLPAGMKFTPFDPSNSTTDHSAFVKWMLRGISGGLGCDYNSFASDLEGVNFSSLRAGAIEARDSWKILQSHLIKSLHARIFPRWLRMALLTGQVKNDRMTLPASKFDKFNKPVFKGRSWQWVDPLKDMEANVLAMENRLKTHGDIISEQGGDFEETMRKIERERNIAKKYGVNVEPIIKPTAGRPVEPDINQTP